MKLLLSRIICSSRVRLARLGKSPVIEFRCSARILRFESWLRSGVRVPVNDFDGRLIAVTRFDESQVIPSHLQ